MTYESRAAARECKWLLLFKIILKSSNSLCFPCVFPKFSNSLCFPCLELLFTKIFPVFPVQWEPCPSVHRSRKDSISSLSYGADSDISDQPPPDLYVEEGELSEGQDATLTEQDQSISEEQTYRETMRGILSYMGWSHIPDMDNSTSNTDDNPFTGPKAAVPGKVLVQMPTEDWLCSKLSKLNVTLNCGKENLQPEAGGLMRNQFLRPAKSQFKWYGLFSDQKVDPSAVSYWNTDVRKLNSSYSRIASQAGSSSSLHASCQIS